MRYFVTLLLVMIFAGSWLFTQDSEALMIIDNPAEGADVIVVGTIISSAPNYDTLETQHVVNIEETLKGESFLEKRNYTKTLRFTSPGIADPDIELRRTAHYKIFSEGDRALLLLYNRNDRLEHGLSIVSTNPECMGEQMIKLYYVPGSGLVLSQDGSEKYPFYANKPISAQYYHYNRDLLASTIDIEIKVVNDFPDVHHMYSSPLNLDNCQAYAMAGTDFIIEKPGSFSISAIVMGAGDNDIGGMSYGGIDVIDFVTSPLKQLKSRIILDEIQCRENLILILKHDNSPACVKSETKAKLMQRGWAIDPMFYGLTKSQITDIQQAKFGCKKLGNQTYCDTMVQEKIEYYLQQNKLGTQLEPEPEREILNQKNLIDANNKLREIYQINPSLGPFHFQDVIVGHGIDDGYLIVDVLEKFYYSDEDRELIIQKIADITNEKVKIDFSPSDGITPKDTESTFQYVWNRYLHKNHIQFSPQERSYVNTNEGYHYEKDNKVCSPLVSSSGTKFYISSTFTDEPFKITGTLIDGIKPNDCQKIWKTDVVLLESDRILDVWLNDFFNDSRNTVLFTDYSITEIDTHYSLDEPVTFDFTETGFGDPCIPIEIVYYQDRVWMENIVLVDKIIRDCPVGKGDEFLSSTFDTSKDTEFRKGGDWVNFSVAGEYFVEITNENQPDGKIVVSFKVG